MSSCVNLDDDDDDDVIVYYRKCTAKSWISRSIKIVWELKDFSLRMSRRCKLKKHLGSNKSLLTSVFTLWKMLVSVSFSSLGTSRWLTNEELEALLVESISTYDVRTDLLSSHPPFSSFYLTQTVFVCVAFFSTIASSSWWSGCCRCPTAPLRRSLSCVTVSSWSLSPGSKWCHRWRRMKRAWPSALQKVDTPQVELGDPIHMWSLTM